MSQHCRAPIGASVAAYLAVALTAPVPAAGATAAFPGPVACVAVGSSLSALLAAPFRCQGMPEHGHQAPDTATSFTTAASGMAGHRQTVVPSTAGLAPVICDWDAPDATGCLSEGISGLVLGMFDRPPLDQLQFGTSPIVDFRRPVLPPASRRTTFFGVGSAEGASGEAGADAG